MWKKGRIGSMGNINTTHLIQHRIHFTKPETPKHPCKLSWECKFNKGRKFFFAFMGTSGRVWYNKNIDWLRYNGFTDLSTMPGMLPILPALSPSSVSPWLWFISCFYQRFVTRGKINGSAVCHEMCMSQQATNKRALSGIRIFTCRSNNNSSDVGPSLPCMIKS